jgi:hypothetical protein
LHHTSEQSESVSGKGLVASAPIVDPIREAEELRFVVVVDVERSENKGDQVVAAEYVTPERMALIVRASYARQSRLTGLTI